jgi:hypothetical protein
MVVLLLFLTLQAAAYSLSPPDSFLESDTSSYLAPARGFVATGSFASETRLPGYPFMVAAALVVTRNLGLVVALQALLLFMTGLVARQIAESVQPHSGLITLIFVCFNPAALFYAQQILPDTLFTFFLMLSLSFVLHACRSGSVKAAVMAGIAAGATALIRANGEFVIWLTPLAVYAGFLMLHDGSDGRLTSKMAAMSLFAAYLVCAPWLVRNWQHGEGISFSPKVYRDNAIHDNLVRAVALERRVPQSEAVDIVYDFVRHKASIPDPQWEWFTAEDKYRFVAAHASDILRQGSLYDLGRAMTKSVVEFFFVNDGQTWATFWQLSADQRGDPEVTSRYSLGTVLKGKMGVSATTYASHAVTIVSVLLVRVLGMLGLIHLARRNVWYLLVICGGYVGVFTVAAGFIAYSRYRVPIDPILMIGSALGLVTLPELWRDCFSNAGVARLRSALRLGRRCLERLPDHETPGGGGSGARGAA